MAVHDVQYISQCASPQCNPSSFTHRSAPVAQKKQLKNPLFCPHWLQYLWKEGGSWGGGYNRFLPLQNETLTSRPMKLKGVQGSVRDTLPKVLKEIHSGHHSSCWCDSYLEPWQPLVMTVITREPLRTVREKIASMQSLLVDGRVSKPGKWP